MPHVFESQHSLVKHKLSLLRRTDTEPKKFRELVRELAILLGYEATADPPVASMGSRMRQTCTVGWTGRLL